MIDLIFTNYLNLLVDVKFQGVSDHALIKLAGSSYVNTYEKKKVVYYDWRNYSNSVICDMVNRSLPTPARQIISPDAINDSIITSIASAMLDLVPKRCVTIRGSNAVTSALIQNLKNRKSRAYKKYSNSKCENDFIKLKDICRKLNNEIRRERKRLARLNTTDSKKFWGSINVLMGRRVSQKMTIKETNGTLHKDPEDLANMFISFFVGKIEALDLLCPVSRTNISFDNVPQNISSLKKRLKLL
jgi:hypothetical protein